MHSYEYRSKVVRESFLNSKETSPRASIIKKKSLNKKKMKKIKINAQSLDFDILDHGIIGLFKSGLTGYLRRKLKQ